jgi:hypothetical protein
VVEGARLESVYAGNCIEGSNPFLSAHSVIQIHQLTSKVPLIGTFLFLLPQVSLIYIQIPFLKRDLSETWQKVQI